MEETLGKQEDASNREGKCNRMVAQRGLDRGGNRNIAVTLLKIVPRFSSTPCELSLVFDKYVVDTPARADFQCT